MTKPDLQAEVLRRDAAEYAAKLILASIAAGTISRAGLGAYRLLFGSRLGKLEESLSPASQLIFLPEAKEPSDRKSKKEKVASNGITQIAPLQRVADFLYDKIFRDAYVGGTTVASIPTFWLFTIPTALVSAIGTWKLTDYLLDERSRALRQQELDELKTEFQNVLGKHLKQKDEEQQKALLDPSRRRRGRRSFAEWYALINQRRKEYLDALRNAQPTEKQAQFDIMTPAGDIFFPLLGALGTLYLLLTLGTGYTSYKFFKKRLSPSTMEEALRRRVLMRRGEIPVIHVLRSKDDFDSVYAEDEDDTIESLVPRSPVL